jgi:hypothetical protein
MYLLNQYFGNCFIRRTIDRHYQILTNDFEPCDDIQCKGITMNCGNWQSCGCNVDVGVETDNHVDVMLM